MKTIKYTLVLFLLGYGLIRITAASVYVHTAEDGSVSLSNVPSDDGYEVLIADPVDNARAAPPIAVQKPTLPILANKAQYNHIVAIAARTYGLEGALLHAVISVESRYNPKAVSRAGATGLMQLMPMTARRYGVADSFNPEQNINGGAQYLSYLLKLFNGDVSLALAAYNAGENAVVRSGNRIPPIPETRDYVPKVLDFYRQYKVDL
ncbi:MAG TPA: lytic transglycosylase domain-containing protein [Gallionellaceae bacterium]|nr:lytic transglycosylase domain-containing protein [Gallionellaceae bacterium]